MKIAFDICFATSCYEGAGHQGQGGGSAISFLGATLSISASGRCSWALCLWAPGLYLRFFCASVSKMWPKVPGKSKRAHKGVMLSIKPDIIKHMWDNLVGYSWGLGTLKNISYKLTVIAFRFLPFQVMKVFIGMLCFQIARETCPCFFHYSPLCLAICILWVCLLFSCLSLHWNVSPTRAGAGRLPSGHRALTVACSQET